jgi:CrcB protein
MRLYALVGLGGAAGSIGRYWLAAAVGRLTGFGFPWGTVLINIAGSFAIGCLAGLTVHGRHPDSLALQAFTMAGLCGGFTTFSAFSLQTFELLRAGRVWEAAANVILSVAACVTATALGLQLCRS